jgi:hypothetical protein
MMVLIAGWLYLAYANLVLFLGIVEIPMAKNWNKKRFLGCRVLYASVWLW